VKRSPPLRTSFTTCNDAATSDRHREQMPTALRGGSVGDCASNCRRTSPARWRRGTLGSFLWQFAHPSVSKHGGVLPPPSGASGSGGLDYRCGRINSRGLVFAPPRRLRRGLLFRAEPLVTFGSPRLRPGIRPVRSFSTSAHTGRRAGQSAAQRRRGSLLLVGVSRGAVSRSCPSVGAFEAGRSSR